MRTINLGLKRLADIVLSTIGILVLSPILIIVAIAIKVSAPGPILFKQERLGKSGKPFYIYKFRTMIVNAEHIGEGLRVSTEDDPRITKIGKFLRATSLDELPQLFNVVQGTMSLVGPRPPVTYHPYDGYKNYPEWAKKRFSMRPGITGLTQATVRNSVSWDERIKVDNKYIDKFNILFDIKILFMTVKRVLKKEDIYGNQKNANKKEGKDGVK